jgi:pyruvate,water dikinase
VLRLVRDALDQPQRVGPSSEAALDALLSQLNTRRQRTLADIVSLARAYLSYREQMKDLIIRHISLNRQIIERLRLRWAQRGLLDVAEQIYLLTDKELVRVASSELSGEALGSLLRSRRLDIERARAVEVPRLFDGAPRWYDPTLVDAAANAQGALRGLGVYPGRVEGIARIIRDPRQGAALVRGELLIAPVTDVAWTPLYLRAAAMAVEIGGPLSHGAIVARELALPTVVGVSGLLAHLQDGDRIAIDGATGVVELLERRL